MHDSLEPCHVWHDLGHTSSRWSHAPCCNGYHLNREVPADLPSTRPRLFFRQQDISVRLVSRRPVLLACGVCSRAWLATLPSLLLLQLLFLRRARARSIRRP